MTLPLELGGRTVSSVSIFDDQEDVRQSYQETVTDSGLKPILEPGPLPDDPESVAALMLRADAAIWDHHLRVKSYSSKNGAEWVAECTRANWPALLCTKWEGAAPDEIRRYRRFIPVLLNPSDLSPDSLRTGLAICCDELAGRVRPTRRGWRTLVRVEDASEGMVYVILPSWNANEVVALPLRDLPTDLRPLATEGRRFHTKVNLGAETQSELFFFDWEPE